MADSFDSDELLASLGVEIPWPQEQKRKMVAVECGQKAPAKPRHTEWSNEKTFEFGGYTALVVQTTCEHCGSMREHFEGVFAVEVKIATGARRMQQLGRGQQWPTGGGHRCEVRQAFSQWCPDCIRQLGFDRETESEATPNDIKIR